MSFNAEDSETAKLFIFDFSEFLRPLALRGFRQLCCGNDVHGFSLIFRK